MERGQVRRAIVIAAIVALTITIVGHDVHAPVRNAWGARAALSSIEAYRAHISPRLRGVVRCRFTPSCSFYGYESVRKYGLLRGGARTAWRILRCGPWTKMGTVDLP